MPYTRNSDLPDPVRNALPSDAQSRFREVANDALSRGLDDGASAASAWTAVKNGWEKGKDGQWKRKEKHMSKEIESVAAEAKLVKVDTKLGLVMGWAIICKINGKDYYDLNIDKSGDRVPEHIPEDAMLKGAMDFMLNSRAGNEMHAGPDKGTYVFCWPMTTEIAKHMNIQTQQTGMMVAYKPTPDILAKYESGELKGFSIEGSRVKFEEHDD